MVFSTAKLLLFSMTLCSKPWADKLVLLCQKSQQILSAPNLKIVLLCAHFQTTKHLITTVSMTLKLNIFLEPFRFCLCESLCLHANNNSLWKALARHDNCSYIILFFSSLLSLSFLIFS